MDKNLAAINSLLCELEEASGAEDLARTVLRSIQDTLPAAHLTSAAAIDDFLRSIMGLLWNCKPRFATAIHDVHRLILLAAQHRMTSADSLAYNITNLLAERDARLQEVVDQSLPVVRQARKILVFSFSQTVSRCLQRVAAEGHALHLVLASRDGKHLNRLLQGVHDTTISCEAVDPLALSYVINRIDLALCGALALTADESLVVANGSAAVVAQLHAVGVPRYAMLSTDKFSDWSHGETNTTRSELQVSSGKRSLLRTSYSHDRVSSALFSGLLTEKGKLEGSAIKAELENRRRVFSHIETFLSIGQNQQERLINPA